MLSDILAKSADFDGVSVEDDPLEILALYWALALYEPDYGGQALDGNNGINGKKGT